MPKAFYRQFVFLNMMIASTWACIGGGGGGAACCPSAAASCAPSVPVCPGGSYASSYAGGSYAAPQASYPRPLPAPTGGCGASSGGCSANIPAPQISIISPPLAQPPPPPPPPPPRYLPAPSYVPQPQQPAGASGGAYIPQNLPPPDPASEIENSYDDFREDHTNGAGGVYGKANSYDQGSYSASTPASTDYTVHEPPPPPPAPEQKPNYEGKPPADTGYSSTGESTDEASSTNNVNVEVDEASLNCEDADLRKIVETALVSSGDNLDAARKIESEAAAKFGGRFNSIVSNSEFAYVNWYGKRNCQLRVNDRHSLTWED